MATTQIPGRRRSATFQCGNVKVPPEVGKLLQELADAHDRPVVYAARMVLVEWAAQQTREGSG